MGELKKCIVIPDSYKGTISAIDVCRIMKENILKVFPACQVKTFPVADGGEGTVDCFLYALEAKKREVETTGPYGEPVTAYYAKIGNRAVLEMAQVAGLEVGEFVHVIADCHIYDRHIPAVKAMLELEGYEAPKFVMDKSVTDFYAFTKDSFKMEDYKFHEFKFDIPMAI